MRKIFKIIIVFLFISLTATAQNKQGENVVSGFVYEYIEEGKQEALGYAGKDIKVSVPPVHIMDIDIILNVLLESRTGVRAKSVEVLLLDHDFFKRLRQSS